MKRIRFLYVILAILVAATVAPLLFYALKMLDLNRQALQTNEQELQNTITRSLADEISIYNDHFRQSLENLNRMLQVHFSSVKNSQGLASPEVRKTLERFVSPSNHVVYVTFLDGAGRGIQAGNYTGENDPFLVRLLERAFAAAQEGREYQSEPVLISIQQSQFPAM